MHFDLEVEGDQIAGRVRRTGEGLNWSAKVYPKRVAEKRGEAGPVPRDVLHLVVGQGIVLVIVGTAVGIAGALGLTRYLQSLLYGVRPADPATLAAGAVLLGLVSMAACYLPARRATKLKSTRSWPCATNKSWFFKPQANHEGGRKIGIENKGFMVSFWGIHHGSSWMV